MTAAPWYKCHPRDFNDGMMGMPPEERGVYVTVLNLIYERGGPIPDDAGWIAAWCGCTVRTWRKIRAALIVRGKLFEVNSDAQPCLMNARAASEIADRDEIIQKRSEAGEKGGRLRKAKSAKNNDLAEANAEQVLSKTEQNKIENTLAKAKADDPPLNPDGLAWEQAKALLFDREQITSDRAGTFFGGLLKRFGLEARDLLPAIIQAQVNETHKPREYLTAAAAAIAKRRAPAGPAKRVGFV